jgi:hypothetical protein
MDKIQQEMASVALTQYKELRMTLIQMMSERSAPRDPTDWKAIDIVMAQTVKDINELFGAIMKLLLAKKDEELASSRELWTMNILYVSMVTILAGHFKVVLKHGRGPEAHLHFDRILHAIDEQDVDLMFVSKGAR